MSHGRKFLLPILSVFVLAGVITMWQLISDWGYVSRVFLPGPDRVWAALVRGVKSGDLLQYTAQTVERMLYGWLLASFIAIALGALIGSSVRARTYLGPLLEFLRPLPASAVIPVGISFFGLSTQMILLVVAFGTLWGMLLSTIHGVSSVEPRLIEVSRALRMNRLEILWKVSLPNALPDILAGMRLGLTVALILTVIGEMLASQPGLGQHILHAARRFQAADLYAGVIILGLIGFATNSLLAVTGRKLLVGRPALA